MYQRTIALEGFLQSSYTEITKPLARVATLISVRSFQNNSFISWILIRKICAGILPWGGLDVIGLFVC